MKPEKSDLEGVISTCMEFSDEESPNYTEPVPFLNRMAGFYRKAFKEPKKEVYADGKLQLSLFDESRLGGAKEYSAEDKKRINLLIQKSLVKAYLAGKGKQVAYFRPNRVARVYPYNISPETGHGLLHLLDECNHELTKGLSGRAEMAAGSMIKAGLQFREHYSFYNQLSHISDTRGSIEEKHAKELAGKLYRAIADAKRLRDAGQPGLGRTERDYLNFIMMASLVTNYDGLIDIMHSHYPGRIRHSGLEQMRQKGTILEAGEWYKSSTIDAVYSRSPGKIWQSIRR